MYVLRFLHPAPYITFENFLLNQSQNHLDETVISSQDVYIVPESAGQSIKPIYHKMRVTMNFETNFYLSLLSTWRVINSRNFFEAGAG